MAQYARGPEPTKAPLAHLVSATEWNHWRSLNPMLAPDLGDIDLSNRNLRGANFTDVTFTGATFAGADLYQADFSRAHLDSVTFISATLREAIMVGAHLSWNNLYGANLENAKLTNADLLFCNLGRAVLRSANLSEATMKLVDFADCDLHEADCRKVVFLWRTDRPDILEAHNYKFGYYGADLLDQLKLPIDHNEKLLGRCLSGYDLSGATFAGLDLRGWDLSACILDGATFESVNFSGCNLEGASMCNVTLDGARFVGARMRGAVLKRSLLRSADLGQSQLAEIDLSEADLTGAKLRDATLLNAKLSRSCLCDADLQNCSLVHADARLANLAGANLAGANLEGAQLESCDLKGTNFQRARLASISAEFANFTGSSLVNADVQFANLRNAMGLSKEVLEEADNYILAQYSENVHIELELRGTFEARNKQIEERDFRHWDLSSKNLSGVNFSKASLSGANLSGCQMCKANLSGANLQEALLDGAVLACACLENADLSRSKARHADLTDVAARHVILNGADFSGAKFTRADLGNALLTRAVLCNAVLEDADLQGVQGLYSEQLAGTNINGAKLAAELGQFTGLTNIKEVTTSARSVVTMMLVCCLYGISQVISTKDSALLVNDGHLATPLVDMNLPVTYIYKIGPVFLLALYFWCHFYLQHLWAELAQLPARFQDGREQYQRVYPWFLNAFASAQFPVLQSDRPLFTHIQIFGSVVITWWLVPFTLGAVWLRYLRSRDPAGTFVQGVTLVLAIVSATLLQGLAGRTLRGVKRLPVTWPLEWSVLRGDKVVAATKTGCVLAVLLLAYAWVAFNGFGISSGTRGMGWLSRADRWVVAVADLDGQEVSLRLPNWKDDFDAKRSQVHGANLVGKDLRYAYARRVFLADANLRGAHLQHGVFEGSDLRWADLRGADLRWANLSCALLEGAQLQGTDLRGATLLSVRGLTTGQLASAVVDGETKISVSVDPSGICPY
jgi:uncharacterized protein YjbI with pentapeptide repeats